MKSKVFVLPIILFISILLSAFSITEHYGIVKLKEGLPPSKHKVGGFERPYCAEIKSNNLFYSLHLVKDLSKGENEYCLFCRFDSLSLTTISGSFKIKDNSYYDSVTIKMNDENESLAPLAIYYDKENKIIKYHWLNSELSNESNPGGIPKLMNPKIMLGAEAPDFDVKTKDNKHIKLSSLKGKYVYIDFWGTWCGGCIMELPSIIKLREHYSEEKLFIIGLAAYDDEIKLEKFLKEKPLNYPNALIDTTIIKEYGINSFPSSFLLDQSGKVIGKNLRGEDLIAKVKSRIEKN